MRGVYWVVRTPHHREQRLLLCVWSMDRGGARGQRSLPLSFQPLSAYGKVAAKRLVGDVVKTVNKTLSKIAPQVVDELI